jgi:hypothetical protein
MQLFLDEGAPAGLAHRPPRLARQQGRGADAAGMVPIDASRRREAH